MNKLAIISITAIIGLSSITSAYAFPAVQIGNLPPSEIVQVRDGGYHVGHGSHVWHSHGRGGGRHHGYQDHDGNTGAIIGGLAAGAIIGGLLSSHETSHTRYCSDRYQTYRASDNTYVSNGGARLQCR